MINRLSTDYNLLDALQSINWTHGRGNVTSYRLDPDNGSCRTTGTAYRQIPVTQRTSRLEERRFRVVGQTVHFLGHQRSHDQ